MGLKINNNNMVCHRVFSVVYGEFYTYLNNENDVSKTNLHDVVSIEF